MKWPERGKDLQGEPRGFRKMSWTKGGRGSKYKWEIFVHGDYVVDHVKAPRDLFVSERMSWLWQ